VLEVSGIVRERVIADVYDVDFELRTGDGLAFTGPWTFGKPVVGAEVAVLCNRAAIARAISDRDGLARFKNLADLRFYEVYVKPGRLELMALARGESRVYVRLNGLSLPGVVIGLEDLMLYLAAAAYPIAAISVGSPCGGFLGEGGSEARRDPSGSLQYLDAERSGEFPLRL